MDKIFGTTHSISNLHYKDPNYIPIIFHTFIGYTRYLFIEQFYQYGYKIDVLRFFPASLQTLSEHLNEDQFLETRKYFMDSPTLQLMKEKGILPYGCVDDVKKLDLTAFPSKLDFYDKLNEKTVNKL